MKLFAETEIESIDSISGESFFLCVFGWRGYQLLDLTCARKNGAQCRQKIKTNRDTIDTV